jgi:hypothetical protein
MPKTKKQKTTAYDEGVRLDHAIKLKQSTTDAYMPPVLPVVEEPAYVPLQTPFAHLGVPGEWQDVHKVRKEPPPTIATPEPAPHDPDDIRHFELKEKALPFLDEPMEPVVFRKRTFKR